MKTNYDLMGEKYLEQQKKFVDWKMDKATSFLKKHITPLGGKKILNVGSGGGDLSEIIQEEGATVYSIDNSIYMIQKSKQKIGDIAILSDMQNLPFEKNSFDGIISRYAIHYLDNFDKCYCELHRILKPNGIISVIANHPLVDFSINNVYESNLSTKIHLFDGLELDFPSHTFKDYFSPELLKYFSIIDFDEDNEPGYISKGKIPAFIGITAIKR